MAIYNAFCDRVPVYMIAGQQLDDQRPPAGVGVGSQRPGRRGHGARFVKWDDVPVSLPHFAESAVRAYKIAMTPPMAPVLLVADSELQEEARLPTTRNCTFRSSHCDAARKGDSGSVAEAARMLVAAENPVIIADRAARTPAGVCIADRAWRKLCRLRSSIRAVG